MLFNIVIPLTPTLLTMNSSVIQILHRSKMALHSIQCSTAVAPPLAGTKEREKENEGRGSEMSHSCRHISSHEHQLPFFRGKKRSFETKPGVSLDNTSNTSPLCFHRPPAETAWEDLLLVSVRLLTRYHSGFSLRPTHPTPTGQPLHLKHQQFCSCIHIFKFRPHFICLSNLSQ